MNENTINPLLVEIKRFSKEEIAEKLEKFSIEQILNEIKYIPQVVSWFSHCPSYELTYHSMINLYSRIVSLNPELEFNKIRRRVNTNFNFERPEPIKTGEKKRRRKKFPLNKLLWNLLLMF